MRDKSDKLPVNSGLILVIKSFLTNTKFYELNPWFYIFALTVNSALNIFLNPEGSWQGDSEAYGYGTSRDWSLLSFSGNSIRTWPVVLNNLLTSNLILQVALQNLLYLIAWSALVYSIKKTLSAKSHWLNPMVTILALSPNVSTWNNVLLTESYSISILVLVVSQILMYEANPNPRYKWLITGLVMYWAWIKPANFYLLCVGSLFLTPKLISVKKINLLKRERILAAVIFLFVIFSFIGMQRQSNETFGWKLSYKAAGANTVISSSNPSLNYFYKDLSRVPEMSCPGLTQENKWIENAIILESCPESLRWLSEKFFSWYLMQVVRHPEIGIKSVMVGLVAGNTPFSYYSGSISSMPKVFSGIYFGDRNLALRLSNESAANLDSRKLDATVPILIWLSIVSFVVLGITFKRQTGQLSSFDLSRRKIGFSLFFLSLLAFVFIFISSPNEWFRQSIQYQVMFYLSCLIIFSTLKLKQDL